MNKFLITHPKNIHIAYITLLCLILLSIPVYWIFRTQEVGESDLEVRQLAKFADAFSFDVQDFKNATKTIFQGKNRKSTDLFFGQFLNQEFQGKIENASLDQFPLRNALVIFSRAIERVIIRTAYLPFNDPVIPASAVKTNLVTRDAGWLIGFPAEFDESNLSRMDDRIKNLSELIRQHPDIHFFAFYVDYLDYSPAHPAIQYFPRADREQSVQYFEDHLPDDLVFSKMMIDSFEEYQQLYFRSDHHWNIHGTWKAYEMIHAMIAPYYPDIGPKLVPKGFPAIPDMEFYGSSARTTLFPVLPDVFEYVDVDLPAYETYVNGVKKTIGAQDQFLMGKFSKNKYNNRYGAFWGGGEAIKEYRFHNGKQRNLMIICDSICNSLTPFIASHYQHTYHVDLRYTENFSFDEIVTRYNIDDVLLIGSPPRLLNLNSQADGWYIKP